ncbi:MAG: hypothetical protein P8J27_17170 [Mariniblastus sp.]|nr:hypothetical protein [Mariniblastus sp.]
MTRVLKLASILITTLTLLSTCQANSAIETYELGVFTAEGCGVTSTEAVGEANFDLFLRLRDIEATLPQNHVLLEYKIVSEGFLDPLTYQIHFIVIVWEKAPPGPPMG